MKKNVDIILRTARLICSAGAIVFALLQLLGVWNKANYAAIPLLAATLILQSVQEWKQHRKTAIFSFVAALFVVGCTLAVIFL